MTMYLKQDQIRNRALQLSELCITCHNHIISHHIVVLKRQNSLKVGTDRPKLKVKMQSVSDDDVPKRFPEKPRFELVAKGVFRLGRCYILRQGVPGLWYYNED